MKTLKNQKPGEIAAKTLSNRLIKLRLDHLQFNTQEKVAAKAGFADGSVRNLEDPETSVRASLDNIAKAASVFGLEAWELLHPEFPAHTISEEDYHLLQDIKKRFGRK